MKEKPSAPWGYNLGTLALGVFLLANVLLRILQPSPAAQLAVAARQDRTNAIARLLAEGVDVNAAYGGHGRTALMMAAMHGNSNAAALLLEHGARLEIADATGRSAYDYARQRKFTNLAEVLRP